MKRVAIFGGSFDPPGLHHQQIAVAVSRHIESVWVVPFAVRSDKTSSVHAQRRLQMCHRTFLSIPQVHVFERFIDRPVLSMNFLEDLKDLWTQPVEYYFVIGSDMVHGGSTGQSLIQRTWSRGMIFWEYAKFIVIPRKYFEFTLDDLPPHATIVIANQHGSSTEIRRRIRAQQSLDGLVTRGVQASVREHQLYRQE